MIEAVTPALSIGRAIVSFLGTHSAPGIILGR